MLLRPRTQSAASHRATDAKALTAPSLCWRAVVVGLLVALVSTACTNTSPGGEPSSPPTNAAGQVEQSWDEVLGSVSPWEAPRRVRYESYGGLPARMPAPAERVGWPSLLSDLPGRAVATYYAPPKCDLATFDDPAAFDGSSWDPQVVYFLGMDGRWRTLRMGELSLPPPKFGCTDYTFNAGALSPDGRWWMFSNGSAQGPEGWIGLLDLTTGEVHQHSWYTPRRYYPPRVNWLDDDGMSVRIGRTVTQYRFPFKQLSTITLPPAVLENSLFGGRDGSWLLERNLDRRVTRDDPIPVELIDATGEQLWSADLPRPKKTCFISAWWQPHLLLSCNSYGDGGVDTTYVIRAESGSFQVEAAVATEGRTFQYFGEGILTQDVIAMGYPGFWNWRTNQVGQSFEGRSSDSFGYGASFEESVANQLVYR